MNDGEALVADEIAMSSLPHLSPTARPADERRGNHGRRGLSLKRKMKPLKTPGNAEIEGLEAI